uniref:Uncharacterized protein n=1 Tax=Anguilla anguilla TaxID=7936 RepID=A0A0E9SJC1_ANGAN
MFIFYGMQGLKQAY